MKPGAALNSLTEEEVARSATRKSICVNLACMDESSYVNLATILQKEMPGWLLHGGIHAPFL